jgi:hypothetical protein
MNIRPRQPEIPWIIVSTTGRVDELTQRANDTSVPIVRNVPSQRDEVISTTATGCYMMI